MAPMTDKAEAVDLADSPCAKGRHSGEMRAWETPIQRLRGVGFLRNAR